MSVRLPWLESLIADAVFGWRQLLKHKTASAAAILSLALGIGACMAAFRLIDALFLRDPAVQGSLRLPRFSTVTRRRTRLGGVDGDRNPCLLYTSDAADDLL